MATQDSRTEQTASVPKLFISYSWDSDDHKAWVLEFAHFLESKGIAVTLDQWDLQPGYDTLRFMESSPQNDFVLVICTPKYAERANARKGAAGYETAILASQLFANLDATKFIPILRAGEWNAGSVPSWLSGREGVDLRLYPHSQKELDRLLRRLHGEEVGRPLRGPKPAFPPLDSGNPSDADPSVLENHAKTHSAPTLIRTLGLTRSHPELSPKEQELLYDATQDSTGQIFHKKSNR